MNDDDARPHGPSKVSRRSLIAGAAVAVPTAAVLNAGSAWAKPVMVSLIGTPPFAASANPQFSDLFAWSTGKPTINVNYSTFQCDYAMLKYLGPVAAGVTMSVAVTPVGPGWTTNWSNPGSPAFGASPNAATQLGWATVRHNYTKIPPGTYSLVLTLVVTPTGGGAVKTVTESWTINV